jgi:hypothetical protein
MFQVIEKTDEDGRVEIYQRQRRDSFPVSVLHVAQQQSERVAVACDGARARIALGKQVLQEEVLEELGERYSGCG